MEYDFQRIEKDWKKKWEETQVYKVTNDTTKPKFYILDMFPYPSGAGLHVGHPLGYIASDIYARYKRLKGFNVLHPMGFDAFGLPAEQYALETGQHPAVTTENNIKRYREQLDNIGFCYDWSREVRTSDPKYYKWTQWIFLQLFHSWYDRTANKAKSIDELISIFEKEGNINNPAPGNDILQFTKEGWNIFSEKEKRDTLMAYRLAYQGYAQVWWCEALGTVLANDEVVNGVSERGSHPVERKNMRQWFLRITEYADRLQNSLDTLDWTDAMKEMQRNWIGKSNGAEIRFYLSPALSEGEGDVVQDTEKQGWNTAESSIYGAIAPHRKELKDNLTEAENILWQHLRNNALGVKFRRQHIVGKYIADFICLPKKLIIEVDGKIHEDQKEEDAQRTEYLNEKGFKVIRFTNEQIIVDVNSVVEKIKTELKALSFEEGLGEIFIKVFTTRPDTIFGVDFMVLAPEHEMVDGITTAEQKQTVDDYKQYVKSRSERERMSEVKQITGAFTGAYATHPFTEKQIPIWISEYVLAGYGTGAIMAVPSGDDRDHAFAKHFNIPITNVFGDNYNGTEAYSDKKGTIENSDFLSGQQIPAAAELAISHLVAAGVGKKKVNYKLRDAGFSRQRYWGEPFPIVYLDDIPFAIDEEPAAGTQLDKLPVELPHIENYKPGPEGQGPLANLTDWTNTSLSFGEGRGEVSRETNTMPGYAGSSWYFLRYMDPHNDSTFADRKATDYWNQVDIYIGGTEHAVGHLLYARMWTKVLHDLGHISFDEPFKKLVNQGMIQGSSRFVYKFQVVSEKFNTLDDISDYINDDNTEFNSPVFISQTIRNHIISLGKNISDYKDFLRKYKSIIPNAQNIINSQESPTFFTAKTRVDINCVDGMTLNTKALRNWRSDYKDACFIMEDGSISTPANDETASEYICGAEVEKMSKSKYNVVNPDDIVRDYGADTFRMYEMFLGPIDVSKPWDTKGIEGVHRFLKKLWRLYNDEQKGFIVTDEPPTDAELKTLHKTIKKIGDDIERFSFNTSVSQFMICVNELSALNCHKRAILQPLAILITPFAPHIAEELWEKMKNEGSILNATFPAFEEKYTTENTKKYPVAVNGKTRVEMEFPLDAEQSVVEKEVLADETIQKWLEGKEPKKFIYVKGKMINVVV